MIGGAITHGPHFNGKSMPAYSTAAMATLAKCKTTMMLRFDLEVRSAKYNFHGRAQYAFDVVCRPSTDAGLIIEIDGRAWTRRAWRTSWREIRLRARRVRLEFNMSRADA